MEFFLDSVVPAVQRSTFRCHQASSDRRQTATGRFFFHERTRHGTVGNIREEIRDCPLFELSAQTNEKLWLKKDT